MSQPGMLIRLFFLLIIFTACQSGFIPCAKIRPDKVKKSSVRKNVRYAERNTTASAREVPVVQVKPNYSRGTEVRPALDNVNVEEWDCPKPGTKKNIPKALKDNIRKNKKAYESYYRNKTDSLSNVQPLKSD
jgi:hypothetical protein